jgi:histidine ammonia-lyase
MILEYVSQSAIADIRRLSAPAALGSAVLSRGVEEHAGFSTQSARATAGVVAAYRIVLACELVAAVRALRLRGLRPASASLAESFDLAVGVLPADTADRPLDGDLTSAEGLLPALAALARSADTALPSPRAASTDAYWRLVAVSDRGAQALRSHASTSSPLPFGG